MPWRLIRVDGRDRGRPVSLAIEANTGPIPEIDAKVPFGKSEYVVIDHIEGGYQNGETAVHVRWNRWLSRQEAREAPQNPAPTFTVVSASCGNCGYPIFENQPWEERKGIKGHVTCPDLTKPAVHVHGVPANELKDWEGKTQ